MAKLSDDDAKTLKALQDKAATPEPQSKEAELHELYAQDPQGFVVALAMKMGFDPKAKAPADAPKPEDPKP